MEWLATVSQDLSEEELDALLLALGAERCADIPAIPLDENEQVFTVEGPANLLRKARREPRLKKLSPNSPVTLYPEAPERIF